MPGGTAAVWCLIWFTQSCGDCVGSFCSCSWRRLVFMALHGVEHGGNLEIWQSAVNFFIKYQFGPSFHNYLSHACPRSGAVGF